MRASVLQDVQKRPELPTHIGSAGRFLALLMLEDGALSTESLVAAATQISDGILVTRKSWHLDLQQFDVDDDRLELRRLYLDPLTLWHVASNWPGLRKWSGSIARKSYVERRMLVQKAIENYIKKLDRTLWRSMTALREAAVRDYRKRMPAFLVSYAERLDKFESHSVPLRVHCRQQGYEIPDNVQLGTSLDELLGSDQPLEESAANLERLDAASIALEEVRGILSENRRELGQKKQKRSDARDDLIKLVESGQLNDQPAAAIFVRFLIDRSEVRKGRKALQLSTMRLLTSLLGRRWVAFQPQGWAVTENNGGLISHRVLKRWLADMAGSCHSSTQVRLVTAIYAFVEFLLQEGLTDEDLPKDVMPKPPKVAIVNANWLTPEEQTEFRNVLSSTPLWFVDPRHRRVASAMTDIVPAGGMRRTEGDGLLTSEFFFTRSSMDIVVRPNDRRRLKSLSSSRHFSGALCEPDTVRLLRDLEGVSGYNLERTWTRVLQRYSPKPGRPYTHMDGTMAPLINDCMQTVLGDKTLHHHHLRHSAANTALLALCSRYLPLDQYVDQFPWLEAVIAKRETYEQCLGQRARYRRDDLWAVSTLLGHSSPKVTLRHYIHCMDLLLHVGCSRYESAETIRIMAGGERRKPNQHVPRKTLYNASNRGKQALCAKIMQRCPEAFVQMDCAEESNEFDPNAYTLYSKLEETWIHGRECQIGAFDPHTEKEHVSDGAIELAITEAQALSAIPSGRRGQGFRHPMQRSDGFSWPVALKTRGAAAVAFEVSRAIQLGGKKTQQLTRQVLTHWRENALAKDELAACESKSEIKLYKDWIKAIKLPFKLRVRVPRGERRKHYVGITGQDRRYERAGLIWLFQMLLITQALDHPDPNGGDGSDGN